MFLTTLSHLSSEAEANRADVNVLWECSRENMKNCTTAYAGRLYLADELIILHGTRHHFCPLSRKIRVLKTSTINGGCT